MSAPTPLKVDLEALAAEAGEAVWQRGQAYAEEGRIAVLATSPSKVTARSYGTETYTTVIERGRGRLEMACTCPAFAGYPVDIPFSLSLEVEGERIRGYLDDELVVQGTHACAATGRAGLYVSGSPGARFERIEVTGVAP